MKYIKVTFVVLFVFSFCYGQNKSKTSQPILHTQNDSINYALGLANGEGIKNNLFKSTDLEEGKHVFIKYFDKGFASISEFVKPDSTNTYSEIIVIGNKVGRSIKSQLSTGLMGYPSINVEFELIKSGLVDGLNGNFTIMSTLDAQSYLAKTMFEIEQKNPKTKEGKSKIGE